MAKIKVLLVEDDGIIGLTSKSMLNEKNFDCELVGSGEEAIDLFAEYSPDVVVMDIALNGVMDGITTARVLREKHGQFPILYITEQEDSLFFTQAKETSPTHYIRKPFLEITLIEAVELAVLQSNTIKPASYNNMLEGMVTDGVFIRNNNTLEKVLFDNIFYLKASSSYTEIYTRESVSEPIRKLVVSHPLNNVVLQMGCQFIIRVHKSYCVNIRKIDRLQNEDIILAQITDAIPIGNEFKKDFFSRIKKINRK